MFTTLASSTTMTWARPALTRTSHLLVTPVGGASTMVAVGARASLMGAPGTISALNWTCRSAYGITSGPLGPVIGGSRHLRPPPDPELIGAPPARRRPGGWAGTR